MSGSMNSYPPQPAAPFVDPATGALSRQGYYWLLALFNRTGGSTGISSEFLQEEINTLNTEVSGLTNSSLAAQVEALMADGAQPASAPAIAMADVFGDSPPIQSAPAIAMADVLTDPPPVPTAPMVAMADVFGDDPPPVVALPFLSFQAVMETQAPDAPWLVVAAAMEDAPAPANWTFPVLASFSLSDPPPPDPINPFLTAMMVSDAP